MSDHRIQQITYATEQRRAREGDEDVPPQALNQPALFRNEPRAVEVFIAWERLRLVFNVILIAVVVVLLNPLGAVLLSPILLPAGLFANLCFCAGPVIEGYLCLLNLSGNVHAEPCLSLALWPESSSLGIS